MTEKNYWIRMVFVVLGVEAFFVVDFLEEVVVVAVPAGL